MAVKAVGAVLTIISCWLAGLYFAYRDGYRINDLISLKKSLSILRAEIEYSCESLPSAFSNIADRAEGDFAVFFAGLTQGLTSGGGEGFYDVWERVTENALKRTYLSGEDIACLKRFGQTLGYLDIDLQLAGIGMAVAYIDETVARLGARHEQNGRVYKSVGVLSGILITIMLL